MQGEKFTVGMCAYDDPQGVMFTVQALRMYHGHRVGEVIVVDTNPHSTKGDRTRKFCQGAGVRYETRPGGGTATRSDIFGMAHHQGVVVLDCHVLLAAGALDGLAGLWASDESARWDLISGPLVYDQLSSYSTHFDDTWGKGMKGRWGNAFAMPPKKGYRGPHYVAYRQENKQAKPFLYRLPDLEPVDMMELVRGIGGRPPGQGETIDGWFQSALNARPAALTAYAFEIPAMGLGIFACRKAAWLGFHPKFTGFGGEEWYIHEKFRQAGKRALCLPGLKWWHRFGYPDGVPYHNSWEDRTRNYLHAAKELKLDIQEIEEHIAKPYLKPGVFEGMVEEIFGKAVTAKTELSQQWVPSLVPTQAKEEEPAEPKAAGCGCSGNMTKLPDTLEAWYEKARTEPSDINEHVPLLRQLASQSQTVVEFGVRAGVSTVALLAGQPAKLVSVDRHKSAQVAHLEKLHGATEFEFVEGDSRAALIPECDLLFIDTRHTAGQLAAELRNAAGKVRKWIALHDTVTFGETGEDGELGLLHALRRFVRANPEWSVREHHANNHGFTVLTRVEAEKKPVPSLGRQAVNFVRALFKHAGDAATKLPLEQVEERLDICALCPSRNGEQCGECGCPLNEGKAGSAGKAHWRSEDCPLGNWPKIG